MRAALDRLQMSVIENGPVWGAYRPSFAAETLIRVVRHTPLGRGQVRRYVFRLLRGLHTAEVFDVDLDGVPIRLFPQHNVCEAKALLCPTFWDRPERVALRRAVAGRRAVFIDVGANAGLYSLEVARCAGPGSVIVAIEPRNDLMSRLAFNEALARQHGAILETTRIIPCTVAISDYDGVGHFFQSENDGTGSLTKSDSGTVVPTRLLTSLLQDLGIQSIDALKIDIEGHEDEALIPFLADARDELLPRFICMDHVHRSNWQQDNIARLQSRGYTVTKVTHSNTLLNR